MGQTLMRALCSGSLDACRSGRYAGLVTTPKPAFLGPEHGAAWQDLDVAAAYHARPPYPDEVFGLLGRVLVDEPRIVLDLGCGTGVIARQMAPIVERIDAVDISAAMIDEGRQATGGDHPAIPSLPIVGETREIEELVRVEKDLSP
jgi:SAM-dependent methyltransferase